MRQEVPAVIEEQPPHGADRVPTLTEVLEFDAPPAGAEAETASEAAFEAPVQAPPDASWGAPMADAAPAIEAPGPPPVDTQALVAEVLADLQPRLDMRFEARLREALAPALARVAEGLIREARDELGSALQELVDDAVKRALQRRGLGR
jgi:hypothetical protein